MVARINCIYNPLAERSDSQRDAYGRCKTASGDKHHWGPSF